MELSDILSLLHGWVFLLVLFGSALAYTMFRGRQALINIALGSYLGIFLYQKFPWLSNLQETVSSNQGEAFISIAVFVVFTIFSTLLLGRLMPREYDEKPFESLHMKLLLAAIFTVIAFTFESQFLPLSTLINTGTPLPEIIQAETYAFWWLLLPLVMLYLV